MTSLGATYDDQSVNRTRLKEQLLELIPGLREDKCCHEVLLTFEPDVGAAIREACEYSDMIDDMCIAHAARILHRTCLVTSQSLINHCLKATVWKTPLHHHL